MATDSSQRIYPSGKPVSRTDERGEKYTVYFYNPFYKGRLNIIPEMSVSESGKIWLTFDFFIWVSNTTGYASTRKKIGRIVVFVNDGVNALLTLFSFSDEYDSWNLKGVPSEEELKSSMLGCVRSVLNSLGVETLHRQSIPHPLNGYNTGFVKEE